MTCGTSPCKESYEGNGRVDAGGRSGHKAKPGMADLLFRSSRTSRTDRAYKQQLRHLEQRCVPPHYERSVDGDFCDDPDAAVGWAAQMLVRSNRGFSTSDKEIGGLERRSGLVFGLKKKIGQLRDVLAAKSTSRIVPCDENTQEVEKGLECEEEVHASFTPSSKKNSVKRVSFVDEVLHETSTESFSLMPHTIPDCSSPQILVGESAASDADKMNTSIASTTCSDSSAVVEFSPTRPKLARISRETKITQIAKVIEEFCSLDFDAVAAEDQAALVLRMLTTLKSLSAHDFFWTDGVKHKESRYILLGLEEQDMDALSQLAHKSDGLSDERSFRQAYDELCKARPWLQADKAGLDALRHEWRLTNKQATDLEAEAVDADAYRFLSGPILTSSGLEFTVISLNILAGDLGRPKTHGYCNPEHLAWDWRKEKLLAGFRRALPDLLLLQEVQGTTAPHKSDHFSDLKEALSQDGYEVGAYARLTASNGFQLGTEPGSKSKKKSHIGNAIFIRSHVWQPLSKGQISFAQLLSAQCSESEAQCKRYAEGKQVAAWARLSHMATQRTVVVVSVHIGANWRNPDTQVAQVVVMLKKLAEVVQDGDSVVIGGDFNSMPSSGVYRFLNAGHLPADHEDTNPKDPEVQKLCDENGFHSPLKLRSAYGALCKNEPEFTTICGASPGTPEASSFSGTLDYIWYSPQTLMPVPESTLRMPTVEEASREGGGLPNSTIPSDHVPLGVAMSFSSIVAAC